MWEKKLTISGCTTRRRLQENNLNGRSVWKVLLLNLKKVKQFLKSHKEWNGTEHIKNGGKYCGHMNPTLIHWALMGNIM